jgi:Xaa-Pro aminopeptidase
MKQQFFVGNRRRINDLIVLSAYNQMQRGNDASFMFEQEANFWYITGINAPNWRVIVDGKSNREWLVSPDVDQVHQTFDGSLSWEEAKRISGITDVLTPKQAEELLTKLSKKNKTVFTLDKDPHAVHYDFYQNPAAQNLRRYLKKYFNNIRDCRSQLAGLRAIKQPDEIAAIKKAIALTADAFSSVKEMLPDLKYEYEVESEFTYRFKKHSAAGHAYDPIVADEKNACTLHYNKNADELKDNSLLLIDIGARVDGYAADITRTYAIGTPTNRQREIHRAVELAQQKIIRLLIPGLSVEAYHSEVDNIMKDALISLRLIKSKHDTLNYRKYFPHAISHGLGIDVHDSLGRPTEFLTGMVLTVEPGIYIPEEGIGVRIEDDILITDKGHESLSAGLATSL